MHASQQSQQSRNRASSQKNWDKVEQHLTNVEKTQGMARALALRERFERGEITLGDMEAKRLR